MIKISLTDFIDFISASGQVKQNKVAAYKRREDYGYNVDYWRELRNCITDYHADPNLEPKYFDAAAKAKFIDAEKRKKCEPLLQNYKKFLGRKQIESKDIIKCDWQYSKDLTIRVNPELHLIIKGKEQIVKLYFKKDALSKNKVDMALVLMKVATQDVIKNVSYSIFDLAHDKIWTQDEPKMKLLPLLKGEAESYITIYKNLP